MQLKICTLRAFVSVKISPLQLFFWMFPSFCQMNVKSWKGCLGLTESAPLLTVIKAASSRSHLPKISLVSVFWAAPRALTLELKTICLRCRITSRWCFFVPLGGIIFQLLSYLHEAVFVLALSVLCSVFFPQLLPVLVDCSAATFHGLRHIWALFNFRLLTYHYYAGCRGGCGLHLLTVESPSSASRFFFCAELSWRRLSNVRLKQAGKHWGAPTCNSCKSYF